MKVLNFIVLVLIFTTLLNIDHNLVYLCKLLEAMP